MKIEFKNYQLEVEERILISKCNVCAEGKIIELKGRNGVGKSTLINSMMSSAYQGEIIIDEQVISPKANNVISFIPQQPVFIEGSNLGYHLKIHKIDASLGQQFLNEFDKDITLKSNISELSGGQRQIVNLMLGLLKKSSYLVIDEPFNFLSTANMEKIKTKIYADQRPCLIVTHNNNMQADCSLTIEKRVITCQD